MSAPMSPERRGEIVAYIKRNRRTDGANLLELLLAEVERQEIRVQYIEGQQVVWKQVMASGKGLADARNLVLRGEVVAGWELEQLTDPSDAVVEAMAKAMWLRFNDHDPDGWPRIPERSRGTWRKVARAALAAALTAALASARGDGTGVGGEG